MCDSISTDSAAEAQRIHTVLQDVFGASFDVVACEPSRPEWVDGTDAACVAVNSVSDSTFEVIFSELSVNECAFAARGVVESLNRDAVARSAQTAQTILGQDGVLQEMNAQLQYFMEQVTGDLEEACWFRTLADRVAACRADDPLSALCDRILPQLRSLLHARSVMVVLNEEHGGPSVLAIDSAAENPELATSIALAIAAHHGDAASGEAFVWNSGFRIDAGATPLTNSLDAFILANIGSGSNQVGWLVAVDRQEPRGPAAQSRRSEAEFGTHEATLMETAAVLLATHAANIELFAEQEATLVGVVTAMVNALDARDPYTRGHSHRVARIGRRIAQQLRLPEEEVEDIYLSGLLHDVGKIGVADYILLKNGPLEPDERRQIERHAEIGHAILSPVRQLSNILPGVLHHHEQVDGSGYPAKLKADRIPLAGRILAVADAYDAMTTSRPYRTAMPVSEAEYILLEGAGSHWDETIVAAFFEVKADVERIYEDHNAEEPSEVTKGLQYGRFEDVTMGAVSSLVQLAPSE